MVTTSSALQLAKISTLAALCTWAASARAQNAGAGMGGAVGNAGAAGATLAGGAGDGGGMASSGAGGIGGTAAGGSGGLGGTAAGGSGGMGGESAVAGMSAGGGAAGSGGAPSSNLLRNGTFDTVTDPWWGNASNTNPDFPADQTLAITDGRLCSTMTAAGENIWDVVVGYSGVALLPNQHYRISFSAFADVDRSIKVKTGLNQTPWTDFFILSVPLTTTAQTFEYTYLNLRNDAAAQFQFQIGKTPGTVCIDDVVLEPVPAPVVPAYQTPAPSGHPFKDYKAFVKIGTAVDTPSFLSNARHNAIVAGEFSMITPANSMKMNLIQPVQGMFDFTDTDGLVAWAQANNLEFRGHPLIWHTQAPGWLNDGTFDRDQMIAIMYAHIDALMTRYQDLPYWDVVNEAIESVGGAWTFRPTIWHDRIGPDFIDLAFTRARAADPDTKLLYNDYNIEQMGHPKADRVFELVRDMKARNVPIDAIGLQSHYFVEPNGATALGVPNMQAIRDNMARYAAIGVDVHITETDFRIGKPLDATKTELQNKFYAELLAACIEAPNCSHFTVWGLSDLDSWVPNTFPDYDFAHVWDTELMPKPSYFAMSDVLAKYNTDGTPIMPGSAGSAGAAGAAGSAGSAGSPSSAGSAGSTSAPLAPAGKSEDTGGCSLAARTKGTGPWLLTTFAALGVFLWRRRSQQRR
jgi:endo-1,4-beta-xylanase